MAATLRHPIPARIPVEVDERAARAALRDQIARLEERLAGHITTAFPRSPTPPRIGGSEGARLQTLAELEERRDALDASLAQIRRDLDETGERQELARGRMEAIMLDPAAHKWERVSHDDIGDPGCRQCHARPRMGLLGMLMNWWRVVISSGCPLWTHWLDQPR